MHAAIAQFSSNEFYAGELTAPPEVAAHLLCDLPGVMQHFTIPVENFSASVFSDGLMFELAGLQRNKRIN